MLNYYRYDTDITHYKGYKRHNTFKQGKEYFKKLLRRKTMQKDI